jgi:protein-disulfide isomerase
VTYAPRVTLPRTLALILLSLCLSGASCSKSAAKPKPDTELPPLTDEPQGDKKPVEGADVSALSDADKGRFEALADKLPSPCGKAHSLRTSRNTDESCVRARFAVPFLVELLKDGADDDLIKEIYMARYPRERKKLDFEITADSPHAGPADAPVKVVEFFDYGCPACGEMYPVVEELLAAYPRDLVVYYKQFPLAAHADSPGAAQAALAAGKQGKYLEMHKLLFADQYAHKKDDLIKYAEKLGLDMKQFETDYQAAATAVEASKAEGEKAGVTGTPTLYLNGVLWEGPRDPKYMKMCIEEELAVNH